MNVSRVHLFILRLDKHFKPQGRRPQARKSTALALTLLALIPAGCNQQPSQSGKTADVVEQPLVHPASATAVPFSQLDLPPQPPVTPELIAQGRTVYEKNCAICHGPQGDGQGEAAPFLVPKPRDFVKANYRLRTTLTGELPTDEDLFRSISLGLPGTPMPPWRHVLNDQDRWALVEYVKTFSPRFQEPDPPQVVDLGKPPPKSPEAAAQGKQLFVKYNCVSCHGEAGVGDGPSVPTLVNDTGQSITPRNLTKPGQYKSGYSTTDIARSILTGFNGTPMTGFAGAMPEEDAWKLAYYIETLAKPSVVTVAQASRDTLQTEDVGAPDVRLKVIERAWKYEPDRIRVKQGQVIEITFEPTDNGLGAGHGLSVSGYDEVASLNGAMVGIPKKIKFRADRAGEFTFYCSTQCSTDKLHPTMNGTLIVEPGSAPVKTASKQPKH